MGTKHIGAGILLVAVSFNFARADDWSNTFLDQNGLKFKTPSDAVFLGNGAALVTQRADGKVIWSKGGAQQTILDLPVANRAGQGLYDVALSPKFDLDHRVYLYYTSAANDGGSFKGLKLGQYVWNVAAKKLTLEKTNNVTLPAGQNNQSAGIVFDSKARASVALAAPIFINTSSSGTFNTGSIGSVGSLNINSGILQIRGPSITSTSTGSLNVLYSNSYTGGTTISGGQLEFDVSGNTYASGMLTDSNVIIPINWRTPGSTTGAYTILPSSGGSMGTITFNGRSQALLNNASVAAGITLLDFAGTGAIGGGTNNFNPAVDFAGAQTYPYLPYSMTGNLLDASTGATSAAYTGSFTLLDTPDDPNFPGYHILGVAQTPEPTAGAILLCGAGVLMKRRRQPKTATQTRSLDYLAL